jgi:alpha-glucosidase
LENGSLFAKLVTKGGKIWMNYVQPKITPAERASRVSMDEFLWWEKGILYQVYPRSFKDTDGDGIGDLKGIISKLDYIKWLGADAVWLSPIHVSPMADFGYDISNYRAIDPVYGTMDDFDELVARAHEIDLRIIMDAVPNHTSDQHAWFLESKSSRDNPRRNWYIWEDPAPGGGPPNNWLSMFGGSAWEYDETTGQYYYHAFLKEQPDLNWRNQEVRDAWDEVLRFWLDRGVDGFRVDVLWHLIKDDKLRDNPKNPGFNPSREPMYNSLDPIYTTDRPEVHDVVQHIRSVINEYGHDKLFIGEIYLPVDRLIAYYGPDANGTNMPYNFQLALLPWQSNEIMKAIDYYESHLPEGAWPNWVLGNHDQPRVASRVAHHQVRGAQLLLLTLRGTPTMYYGDELGMRNVPIPPDDVHDPFELREPGKGNGRDPERTPMPWTNDELGGFTTAARPWLPMGQNKECSVEEQRNDPDSILSMVRYLIQLRKETPALCIGAQQPLPCKEPVAAYCRSYQDDYLFIIINFSDTPQQYPLPASSPECVFSTHPGGCLPVIGYNRVDLRPGEGAILRVTPDRHILNLG